MQNIDEKTVEGFGDEWQRYDQSRRSTSDLRAVFESYFGLFPWDELPKGAIGMDLGCGSGRWSKFVVEQERVGELVCVDPSEKALTVAKTQLAGLDKCRFLRASAGDLPLDDSSLDFAYSLGVLHHTPDPQRGMLDAVRKLKSGAPFLVYLYYAMDNRPAWFRAAWRASDVVRRVVSKLPFPVRAAAATGLAAGIYWPTARASKWLDGRGMDVSRVPLSAYRHKSFYVMKTDSLDRFGTRVEKRFTKAEMTRVMEASGLERVTIQDGPPYYCALGYRS